MKQISAYICYYLGDWISRPMCRFDWAWMYPTYNRLMLWSSNMDTQGKIWKKEQ